MSHFAVLVIGADIENQLAPYHEFECTGLNNEFVQDVDVTDEAREEFAGRTETRLKAPDGSLHNFFDEEGNWRPEFSQPDPSYKPLFKGDNPRRTYFVPEGYEKIEVPASEVSTFVEFAGDWYGRKVVPFGQQPDKEGEHKYGYILVDESGEAVKVVRRTNPNKKWDGWKVGGRWSGWLKLKPGADGEKGSKGLMGSCSNDGEGYADHALKGAIDFDGMRDEAGRAAAERWHKVNIATGGTPWETWETVRAKHPGNIEEARREYHAQPSKEAASKALDNPWDGVDEYLVTLDQYVQQERDRSTVLYAVVKDGKWIAKGNMGWFGMSNDTEDQSDWNRKVNEMLDAMPDDTPITVVDCHI